jgi:hypothetical protein
MHLDVFDYKLKHAGRRQDVESNRFRAGPTQGWDGKDNPRHSLPRSDGYHEGNTMGCPSRPPALKFPLSDYSPRLTRSDSAE